MPVIAARSPADCFECRDRGRAHRGAIHDAGDAADRRLYRQCGRAVAHSRSRRPSSRSRSTSDTECPKAFHALHARPETLARPWVKPGTPGLVHRIGGIEKDSTRATSPTTPDEPPGDDRHARRPRSTASRTTFRCRRSSWATDGRQARGRRLGLDLWPDPPGGRDRAGRGLDVSHIHIRHIWPLPRNLGELLDKLSTRSSCPR